MKIRARGAQLFEQPEKMIGCAPDRNGGEALVFREIFLSQKLFRGEGQQQAKMLASRRNGVRFPGQQRAKIWRSEKLNPERGKACCEQPSFERLDLAAGWNDDNPRALALPRFRGGLLEPAQRSLLPRRFRRMAEKQRVPALGLKFEFQLHRLILAEGVDNRCPTVNQIPLRCAALRRMLASPLRA